MHFQTQPFSHVHDAKGVDLQSTFCFHQLLWWKNKKTLVINHKITVKIKVIFISTGTSDDNYVTIITQTILKGGGKDQEKAEKQVLTRIILWGNITWRRRRRWNQCKNHKSSVCEATVVGKNTRYSFRC